MVKLAMDKRADFTIRGDLEFLCTFRRATRAHLGWMQIRTAKVTALGVIFAQDFPGWFSYYGSSIELSI